MNESKVFILASKNPHKAREVQLFIDKNLQDIAIKVQSCSTLDPQISWTENGHSFAENAYIKAKSIADKYPSVSVLADDSGLIVPYLGDRPGIYSSRFAGEDASDEDNNRKLLAEMAGVKNDQRQAFFICHLCCLLPCGTQRSYVGKLKGEIAETPQGTDGFGYDPLFIPQNYTKSLAQLGSDIKNEISHRSAALKSWLADMDQLSNAFE